LRNAPEMVTCLIERFLAEQPAPGRG